VQFLDVDTKARTSDFIRDRFGDFPAMAEAATIKKQNATDARFLWHEIIGEFFQVVLPENGSKRSL
jgi:hypothetical protein